MSESRFPRWQQLSAAPVTPLQLANTGVTLSRAPMSVTVTAVAPLPVQTIGFPETPPPLAMPMIPSVEIRRCADFLRSLYRQKGCRAALALYLDVNSGQWQAALPQQLASPTGFRANLRGLPDTRLPKAGQWRLAGSVQSFVMSELPGPTASYMDELPGFDGVHVIIDPRHLFLPRVILRLQGDECCEVEPATVLFDRATGFEPQMDDVWCKDGDV